MTYYGRYQTAEELYRSPMGRVVLAHLMGDDDADQFVVKAFDPSSLGLLEAPSANQGFLDRAGLQKFLTDHGAGYWAPVYEMKLARDGAYYVTDYYPLTVQKLLDAQAPVQAADLHHLIRSICQGLLELQSIRKRAHANLRPGNILISTPSLNPRSSIFLADPGLGGRSEDDRVSDLRGIGAMIYRLVVQKPFVAEQDWPIPDSPQWLRLGRDGAAWRDLCRQLLDPETRPRDLGALAVAVERMTPRPPSPGRSRLLYFAVPVVLVVAAIAIFGQSDRSTRNELAAIDQAWFARFAHAMEDPVRREQYRADPDLAKIVSELETAEARHVPLDASPPSGFHLGGDEQSRSTLDAIGRIEADLSPSHWKRVSDLDAMRQQFGQWNWSQPAGYLGELIDGTRPVAGADVVAGVDRLNRVGPVVSADGQTVSMLYQGFIANLDAAQKADPHTLGVLADSLRRSAVVTLKMDDQGMHGMEELQTDAPLGERLAQIGKTGWPGGYGRDRLAREVESHLNMKNPTSDDVRQWVAAVSGYALVSLDPSSQVVAELKQSLARARDDIERQGLGPEERIAADSGVADAAQHVKSVVEKKYLRKEVLNNSGELSANASAVKTELESLRKTWVKLDNPGEWLAFIDQPLSVSSDRLKTRWNQWVDGQRARSASLAADHSAFVTAKKAGDAVHAALLLMDQKFPPVPVGLSEKFAAVAWDKREKELFSLSQWAAQASVSNGGGDSPGTQPSTGPSTEPSATTAPATLPSLATLAATYGIPCPPDDLDVDDPAARYAGWINNLHDLAEDFPITRELLTLNDRPDQKWRATERPEFWNDANIQTLVRLDVSRLANLQAVCDASRDQLVHQATTSDVPEIALASWSRLGLIAGIDVNNPVPPVTPAWPTQKGELDADLAMRGRLAAMLKGLKDAAEAAAPLAEIRRQGPIRWRTFTEVADPDLLPASARLMRKFDVNEREVNQLSPPAHFDFFLCLAHAAVTGGHEPQIKASIDNLRVSAQQAAKDHPELGDLLTRLNHLADPEPFADPKLLAQKPGDAYKLSIRNSPYSITFVRVASPGIHPFYLAATETSIGAFMDTVSASGAWTAANTLLMPVPGVSARGPQAWSHAPATDQSIVRYATWRFDDGKNPAQQFDFVPELRQTKFNRHTLASDLGGNPQEEHPMQQIPAQAALYAAGLLNCRLPTTREWRAAYDQFEAKTDPRQWNLRDQTFKLQLDYHASDAPNQWPDNAVSGAFWPAGRPHPGQPVCRENNDGTLLFRKVDTPGGSTFLNLVGNVAEFVCDASDAFDALADRDKPEVVARFAASLTAPPTAGSQPSAPARTRLFVIGGSALSAPELDVTEPYPVNSALEPFADVGFRLAFTAPAGSLAERLKWVLESQPYLPPLQPATMPVRTVIR